VGINGWVAHGNKAIFGDDADTFNPDRWLQQDKERISAMNRHWMPVSTPYQLLSASTPSLHRCFMAGLMLT
jgi:cytochrome P450